MTAQPAKNLNIDRKRVLATKRKLIAIDEAHYRAVGAAVNEDKEERKKSNGGTDVYYSRFETKDKWYILWMRQYKSGWAVKAQYMHKDVAVLVVGASFWEEDWGAMTHGGYKTFPEAMKEFKRICDLRESHGYEVTEAGHIVDGIKVKYDVKDGER